MKSISKVVVWLVTLMSFFLDIASKSNIIAVLVLLKDSCMQSPKVINRLCICPWHRIGLEGN